SKAKDMTLVKQIGIEDDITAISSDNTDVVVEFSVPSASLNNVVTLVKQGVNVIVGTTGWTEEKLQTVKDLLQEPEHNNQIVFIVPNFAISAVLAQYFATKAARYFESVEIIEMHHPDKVDAPSGTAIHTAQGVAKARAEAGLGAMPDNTQGNVSSRGELVEGIPVHAIRLRGLNAHEEILFGNAGEQLVLRADSFDRISFMPGVLLAVRAVVSGKYDSGLLVGLESILDL
ncbi:MAG: 4-hydroxy-tetrahydrodipicolinate reductase, partial [Bifidobacteriaceae bacterium]|nr:4-hydroxy-tetrahydrodipicolinate reductase [Bifidobacteriaceae bacterium]